jgi:hypothetical protein
MSIGYRPPVDKGRTQIEQLRAQYDQYQSELLDMVVARLAPKQPIHHPIPAIRGWRLDRDFYLTSLAMPTSWDGPVLRADNKVQRNNMSGLWAVKPAHMDILPQYRPDVVGTVALSGIIIEHEYGYRGEVCVIRELFMFDENQFNRSAQYLEERYECDVHLIDSMYQLTARRFQ